MTPELSNQFAAYFVAQEAARAERVNRVVAAMTKRERQLVWEIAVMAGVQGRIRSQGGKSEIPADSTVVFNAILGCLNMSDLYPTFQRIERIAARRARKAA